MSDYRKKRLIISIVIIVLVCALFVGGIVLIAVKHRQRKAQEEWEALNTFPFAPVYINALCPGPDDFWIIRTTFENGEYCNHLYRLDENGQEEYIRRLPWTGLPNIWNDDRKRFYYLSDGLICEYDPETAAVVTYELPEGYTEINHSDGDFVYISDDYSHDAALSLETLELTSLSGVSGGNIIEVNDDYVLSKGSNYISCYRISDNTVLWTVDAVNACISSGMVYYCLDTSGGVYTIGLEENANILLTNIETRTRAVADAGEYVVCAVKGYQSIEFKALYPDGTVEDIAVWENTHYNLIDSVLLEVWNGKLYCTITTDEGLFSCDLP